MTDFLDHAVAVAPQSNARKFALVVGGRVRQVITEVSNINEEFHPGALQKMVDVTLLSPAPQPGWTHNEDGSFAAPTLPAASPEQLMVAALAAGVAIESTGTPALSGTYDASGPRWDQMRGEAQYVATFGAFSGGLAELDWPVAGGEVVFTTTAQFMAVVRAVADWITAWQRHVDGKGAAPAGSITIA